MKRAGLAVIFSLASLAACAKGMSKPSDTARDAPSAASTPASFADDVRFLEARGPVIVLRSANGARVAVSPKYQGRVMTSSFADDGPSLGWVNRPFVEAGKTGTAFDNYGGEDRFWLGPEGGQLGLYFPPGKPFVFGEWQTPHEMQEGAWAIKAQTLDSVTFTRTMRVTNWSGTTMTVAVERTVRVLDPAKAEPWLGTTKAVAFETVNTITNAGAAPWTKETGLPSIWILGMFAPAADASIVVPFRGAPSADLVNDRYFGKVPSDRLVVRADAKCVVFTADGHHRSKIGLRPDRTTGRAFAYSPSSKVLTMVSGDPPPDATKPYVNSLWEKQDDPLRGDALNAYNDGPTEPGKPSLGGFFELETSSPAAALKPGESMTHTQRTVHALVAPDAAASGGLPLDPRCFAR